MGSRFALQLVKHGTKTRYVKPKECGGNFWYAYAWMAYVEVHQLAYLGGDFVRLVRHANTKTSLELARILIDTNHLATIDEDIIFNLGSKMFQPGMKEVVLNCG